MLSLLTLEVDEILLTGAGSSAVADRLITLDDGSGAGELFDGCITLEATARVLWTETGTSEMIDGLIVLEDDSVLLTGTESSERSNALLLTLGTDAARLTA